MPVKSEAARARKAKWRRGYDRKRRKSRSGQKRPGKLPLCLMLDGEGVGSDPHRYVMLSWADSRGRSETLEAPQGKRLGTEQILSWLDRTLPRTSVNGGFAIGYDAACIFRDLDDQALYQLEHVVDRRFRKHRRKIVEWRGWQIDKRGTRIAFRHGRVGKWRVIWDLFRFAAKSFVWTIGPKGWNVATPDELAEIEKMKARRGKFRDRDRAAMRHYNVLECKIGVRWMLALIQAHRDAGLPLRSYYGPGSTAAEMFEQMVGGRAYFRPLQKLAKQYPPEVTEAIASAFFGGRFEHRVIGWVQ